MNFFCRPSSPGLSPVCPRDIRGVVPRQPDQKVYVYVPFSCLILVPNIVRVVQEKKRSGKMRGLKKHINFFNKIFGPPPKTPHFGPPSKKFRCLIYWERTQKRDPHKLFRRDFWGQKEGPKRAVFGHNSLFFLDNFLALKNQKRSLFRQGSL